MVTTKEFDDKPTGRRDLSQIVAGLKEAGHSPQKALEIAIDYERGDDYALNWVRQVFKDA